MDTTDNRLDYEHESTSALILTDAMEKPSQKDIDFWALEVFHIWTGTATQRRDREGKDKRDKERIVGMVESTEQTSEEEEVWLKMKATDQVRGRDRGRGEMHDGLKRFCFSGCLSDKVPLARPEMKSTGLSST